MKKGFTLIELLVVVLIIGILAAVALPKYQLAVLKSRYAILKPIVQQISTAEEIYYLSNGNYTLNLSELDIELPNGGTVNPDTPTTINYPWGSCKVFEHSFRCSLLLDEQYLLTYKIYFQNATDLQRKGIRQCIAEPADMNALSNKLCRQETGLNTPTWPTSSYWEWNYN